MESFRRERETFVRMQTAAYRAAYKILNMRSQGIWPEDANRQQIDEFVDLFTANFSTCHRALEVLERQYGQDKKAPGEDA